MLFASYEFIGFVLVLFALYYLVPKRCQWPLLLLASYVFYFLANPWYLVFITVTSLTVYGCGLWMGKIAATQKEYLSKNKENLSKEDKKTYKNQMKQKKWRVLLLGLLFNLGILAVIKYTNFTIYNINSLLHIFGSKARLGFIDILMPMGISFYTFQALSYLIDTYRGTVEPEKNVFKFALFVSFFPQLVQGPISRFGDLSKTLYSKHKFDGKNAAFGFQRILYGYFKKLVVADRMLIGVKAIIGAPETYQGAYVFVGMIFYALELYADFTGGIDITIGIAQVLGIEVTENFRRPFFSKNIKEYWNRWHITMGTWFTEYIFYPISVCKPMLKFSKFSRKHFGDVIGKRMPVYLASFVVWFATGIWHGASWNFIVWGLGNFVVIMISQELEPLYRKFHNRFHVDGHTSYKAFCVIRTFLLMSALRTFDCYRDVPLTFRMFGTIFTNWNWHILWDGSLLSLGISLYDYIILAVCVVILTSVSLAGRTGSVREKLLNKPYPVRFVIFYGLLVCIIIFGAYGIGFDASQFIYNQF